MRYVILELTPFPGYWQPLATCFLQEAEYQLKFNRSHYYERAIRIGIHSDYLLSYQYQDACKIIEYRQKQASYAQHRLMGYPIE